ncbi:MAG: hypothetical protein IJ781_11715 [Atopobiaceae bacterium]|nr:hypothetical protein [Atopobiaceae bacterium]
MKKLVKASTAMGVAALPLVLALTGCGKKEPAADAQAEEGSTVQEQVTSVIEEKTAEEAEPEEASATPEGFTPFETSYLTMSVAPGWTTDPEGLAEEDANVEMGEAYLAKGFDVVDDATGTIVLVMVYQAAEFHEPFEEPQVSDYITSVEAADPITVGGVELKGYLTSTSTGNEIAEWLGSVNGHFVDLLVVDRSEGTVQRTSDPVRAMLESVTVK